MSELHPRIVRVVRESLGRLATSDDGELDTPSISEVGRVLATIAPAQLVAVALRTATIAAIEPQVPEAALALLARHVRARAPRSAMPAELTPFLVRQPTPFRECQAIALRSVLSAVDVAATRSSDSWVDVARACRWAVVGGARGASVSAFWEVWLHDVVATPWPIDVDDLDGGFEELARTIETSVRGLGDGWFWDSGGDDRGNDLVSIAPDSSRLGQTNFLYARNVNVDRTVTFTVTAPDANLTRSRVQWLVGDKIVRGLWRGMYDDEFDEIEYSVPSLGWSWKHETRST